MLKMKPSGLGLISLMILFFFVMCDDFQEKDYEVSDTDAYAIEAFKDTNTVNVIPAEVNHIDSTGVYQLDYDDYSEDYTSFASIVSLLSDSNVVVQPGQTHYSVTINKNKDNYVLFSIDNDATIVVYTNENLLINLVDESDMAMDITRNLPMELVAGYFSYTEDDVNAKPEPIIQTRNEIELTAGHYVLKFIASEATVSRSFDFVIVEEQ